MQRKFNLPFNQEWLIKRGEALGHFLRNDDEDEDGVCLGTAMMGIHSILADDVDAFDEQMRALHHLSIEECESVATGNTSVPNQNLPSLLHGIDVYQYVEKFPELFGGQPQPEIDDILESELFVSDKLRDKGGIGGDRKFDFVGICNKAKLVSCFSMLNDLRHTVPNAELQPFAFCLSNAAHSIAVGYIPAKGEWVLIDANNLPSLRTTSIEHLCEEIYKSLYENHMTVFNGLVSILRPELKNVEFGIHAELFLNNADQQRELMARIMNAWRLSQPWRAINQSFDGELDGAIFKDGDYWLSYAEEFSDYEVYLRDEQPQPVYIAVEYAGMKNRLLSAGVKLEPIGEDDPLPSHTEAEFQQIAGFLEKNKIAFDATFQADTSILRKMVAGSKEVVVGNMEKFIAKHAKGSEKIPFTLKDIAAIAGYEDLLEQLFPSPIKKIVSDIFGFFSSSVSSNSRANEEMPRPGK